MHDWNLRPARDLGLSANERFRSLQRESGLISTGLHLAWWTMVRSYLALWHRLRITGQQHIPIQPPFIMVANHSSHLDALALAAPLAWDIRDQIFPIAAGDVFFDTPIVSAFAAQMLNALPMWRKNCGPHALAQLRQRLLEEPCAYILFPEGSRSRDGNMLPFKPGFAMLVAQTNVPVIPCHLSGCYQSLSANRRFPRPKRIDLRIGEPLKFANVENTREGWYHIATTTEHAVRSLQPSQFIS